MAKGPSIHHGVAVRLHVDHHVANRSAFLLRGRCFRHFNIEFVFIPRRIPGQQKENQKKKEDIDQQSELNARMMKGRATTQIHMSAMSILALFSFAADAFGTLTSSSFSFRAAFQVSRKKIKRRRRTSTS